MWGTADGVRAWVVSADMGLGHQRATYPLAALAEGGILTLGKVGGESAGELRIWNGVRRAYELVSRIRPVPLLGSGAFALMDRLQRIPPCHPWRDLSRPDLSVRVLSRLLERGLCRALLDRIHDRPLPLITSYLAAAIAADRAGYSPVYCIVCDAEVNRAWVAERPRDSGIHYLVPCERTVARLRRYGVPAERITVTGFPFPLGVLGDRSLDILKRDFHRRLRRLDPGGSSPAFTVTYAVGGAGAQQEIGRQIVRSLREKLSTGQVRLNLVAGVRGEVRDFFERMRADLLPGCPQLRVLFGRSKRDYFTQFSRIIRTTDVLWTKPSELSFYSALGLPIIIAPPLGCQEVCNRSWLLDMQAGIPQEDPARTDRWLFDLLRQGRLAETAWNGYRRVRKRGTYEIADLLRSCGEPASLQAATA
jgi:hypothetical protein